MYGKPPQTIHSATTHITRHVNKTPLVHILQAIRSHIYSHATRQVAPLGEYIFYPVSTAPITTITI